MSTGRRTPGSMRAPWLGLGLSILAVATGASFVSQYGDNSSSAVNGLLVPGFVLILVGAVFAVPLAVVCAYQSRAAPAAPSRDREEKPIELLTLDMLADDVESIESMRDPAVLTDKETLSALRVLLDEGLIAAWTDDGRNLVPVDDPRSDDESLRGYWFGMTTEGRRLWAAGGEILDAFYEQTEVRP